LTSDVQLALMWCLMVTWVHYIVDLFLSVRVLLMTLASRLFVSTAHYFHQSWIIFPPSHLHHVFPYPPPPSSSLSYSLVFTNKIISFSLLTDGHLIRFYHHLPYRHIYEQTHTGPNIEEGQMCQLRNRNRFTEKEK